MLKIIVVVIVIVGVAIIMPTQAQIIEELYDRIESLEERLAAQEAICEIVSVSSDFTTMTVRREIGGEEIDYEGVINTFTTYAGGGVQYQKLDQGDSVLVRFTGARAYTVALMPSIGDSSSAVVSSYSTAAIATGTFSNGDGITQRVFGEQGQTETISRVLSTGPDIQLESITGTGADAKISSINSRVNSNDPSIAALAVKTVSGSRFMARTTNIALDAGPLSKLEAFNGSDHALVETSNAGNSEVVLEASEVDALNNVQSVTLTITATGATLTREDEADTSNDRSIDLFAALTP